jgi:IS5 family transposase
MKQQRTLAMTNGFERYTKKTRRALFLEQMEQVVPWQKLGSLVEPFYPKAGNGRPPVGLERMLRMYFLQQWFNLSDPAVEDAVYESPVMRAFVGIDLGQEPVPDETTLCKFRHLLEAHNLGGAMLETVNLHLESRGLRISQGTIVDATIIAAPSSTKNQRGERDPEMKQTKKGGQWYFGMKAHVGVDSQTKMIHSAVVTPANQADAKVLPHLLHGEETEVWGDQGYVGQTAVIAEVAPQARDCINRRCLYHGKLNVEEFLRNREKSKVRSKVEHVFQVLKLKFGFVKVRYRGIRKNGNRLFALCALVNLYIARKQLLRGAFA